MECRNTTTRSLSEGHRHTFSSTGTQIPPAHSIHTTHTSTRLPNSLGTDPLRLRTTTSAGTVPQAPAGAGCGDYNDCIRCGSDSVYAVRNDPCFAHSSRGQTLSGCERRDQQGLSLRHRRGWEQRGSCGQKHRVRCAHSPKSRRLLPLRSFLPEILTPRIYFCVYFPFFSERRDLIGGYAD